MTRMRKQTIKNLLIARNEAYRERTGSNRPLYLVGTLRKRHTIAFGLKSWTVGINFGRGERVLGQTLAESYANIMED